MTQSPIAVAIHEAAHAVIGRQLGIACGDVTTEGEPDVSVGHAVVSDPRFSWERGDGPKRDAADRFAMALYAGAEAERLLLGVSEPCGDGVDQDRATACLAWAGAVRGASFVGDDAFDRHEARLRAKVRPLVLRHSDAIRAVASALMDRKSLAAEEVDRILQPPTAMI